MTGAELQAVHAKADETLREAIELTLLTGQRPADVLKMNRERIRDEALCVAQNHTDAKRAIDIVHELTQVLDRIVARKHERLSARI